MVGGETNVKKKKSLMHMQFVVKPTVTLFFDKIIGTFFERIERNTDKIE